MVKLAHISDLHFGRIDQFAIDALAASLKHHRPDLVVATGDLTQSGRWREFRSASKFLEDLGVRYFCVPGNHDTPVVNLLSRFLNPWRRFEKFFGAARTKSVTVGEATVIGVNSARRAAARLNWSHGRLNSRQVAEAVSIAEKEKERRRFVFVACHHPFELGDNRAGSETVAGAKAAARLFAKAGVDAILTGHVHVSSATILADTGGRILSIRAGTSGSARGRGEAAAYNLIRVEDAGVTVETHRLHENAFQAQMTASYRWRDGAWRDETPPV